MVKRKGMSLELFEDRGVEKVKGSWWDEDKGMGGGFIKPRKKRDY